MRVCLISYSHYCHDYDFVCFTNEGIDSAILITDYIGGHANQNVIAINNNLKTTEEYYGDRLMRDTVAMPNMAEFKAYYLLIQVEEYRHDSS